MTTGIAADPTPQGEIAVDPPESPALSCPLGHNKVYKCGPLYLSSKGIGWTSWKKRWFILTRTSLVFFRSDPNVIPQKGSEVNLTLGGIDLNSSGSVVVKEDKKLITVLFPDGRDGRAFTLKAETMEDLHEWKAALEEALANAPVAVSGGQNGILRNDQQNAADVSSEQLKDRSSPKSLVVGRPILLALEDIDGTPSFLEKALRFLEEYGVKIEGILRQAADVDDVEHRIREYEKGKIEFSPEEDPHVIADCIKYVLRELPSSPVPASCCKALLEAFRTDRGTRVAAMRSAICETFPEPNRRLLQRILMMMQTVASNKVVNRMSISAVAACMAPLLLRPLLAGDCELENDFDVGGDGSVQLLQAAAAANHAQAIVITLLEDYDSIFGEGSLTPGPYTDTDESGSESEEITDDDEDDYDDEDDEDDDDGSFEDEDDEEATEEEYDVDVDETSVQELSVTGSETDENEHDQKVLRNNSSGSESPEVDDVLEGSQDLLSHQPQSPVQSNDNAKTETNKSSLSLGAETPKRLHGSGGHKPSRGHVRSSQRPTVWGRTSAKKNLSMESIDFHILDEEAEILNLEADKADLQHKVEVETKANSLLIEGLQKRKHDLVELRLVLEKDVAKLQEELEKQMELRAVLEGGLGIPSISIVVDEKLKEDMEEIAQAEVDIQFLTQKACDIQLLLSQREQNSCLEHDTGKVPPSPTRHKKSKSKEKQADARVLATSSTSENPSRSKHLDKRGSVKEKKQDPSSLNKPLSSGQQTDGAQKDPATTIVEFTNRLNTSASKKSTSRGEGSSNNTSALSKLTNRLNFLKERRTQIASELQNLDKGRSSSQPAHTTEKGGGSEHQPRGGESEHQPSLQNTEKGQPPKGQSSEKGQPPKGQSSEKGQPPKGQSSEKGQSSKGQSSEKGKELENNDSHSNPENAEKGKKSEAKNVEWGKSESFPVPEKDQSKVTPRTFSR